MSQKQLNSFEEEKNNKDQLPTEANFMHEHIEKFEVASPSVFFTAKVMDKVRALQYKTFYKPIFNKKVGFAIICSWIALMVYATTLGQVTPKGKVLGELNAWLANSPLNLSLLFLQIDTPWLIWIVIIPLMIWSFILLDRLLKKRFGRLKTKL